MITLTAWPPVLSDSAAAAIITLMGGVLGYAGKSFLDFRRKRRLATRSTVAKLLQLFALLEEGRSIFLDQNFKVRRLMQLLRERLPKSQFSHAGFDETFFRLYPELTDEEREVHSLIRSTTLNSMRRVNLVLRRWLDRNTEITRRDQSDPDRAALAEQLMTLRLHLIQWHDKFEASMNDERHSLVYLADEKKQGQGFPKDLEGALARVLGRSSPGMNYANAADRGLADLQSWE